MAPLPRPSRLAVALTAAVLSSLAAPAADAREVFETFCFSCHSGDTVKGGLALDKLLAAGTGPDTKPKWEKVWKTVRHEFMPPAKATAPTAAERLTLTRWVERNAFRVDPAKPDPGRVTIRRLNRMEYQTTVRDLFGLDLDLMKELPPDDTAFGFDNIGDAQTLSPNLLETYLTLAERVVADVIPDPPRHPRVERGRPDFTTRRGEQTTTVPVAHDGRYEVEIEFGLGGWHDTTGDYEFAAALGGQSVVEKAVVSDGGTKTYRFVKELTLPKGDHPLVLTTVAVGGKGKPLTLSPKVAVTGPLGTDIYEYSEAYRRLFFRGPAPADADARRAYARDILDRFAGKAFRRPVDESTLNRLVAIALAGKTFDVGVAQAVTAVLSSPRFYFRAELQPHPDDPKAVHALDDFALASRLSYLFWLSLPDDELTALAARGELRKHLGPQVKRMLADPKSARFFEDFTGQWLRTRNVLLTPVSTRNEDGLNAVRRPMKRETEMLFEFIAREDRDLLELLTADYSFLNEDLARHYGIDGVRGDEMRKIALPAGSRRVGVLTHGSVLLSTSNPNRTSPVKRGLFVLENLLGREVPPPPPNVGELEDPRRAAEPKTLREQLAKHRAQASCAACHNHFDPIGLALENFDNTGRWRDKDFGLPIDPSTVLASGEAIAGAADLSRALADQKDVFYRCVTEKLLTYALGRGLDPADAVVVDRIAARVAADGGKFSTLLMAVVESEPFLTRRGDGGDPAPQLTRAPTLERPKSADLPRRRFGNRPPAAVPTPRVPTP